MATLSKILNWIGYAGGAIFFIYIEISGIIVQPLNVINPIYHFQAFIRLVSSPLFFLFVGMILVSFALSSATERRS